MQPYLRSLLTFNENLGVHTFNLPPGRTCPGKSPWCRRFCYGKNGNHQYPSVKKGQGARLAITRDLSAFVERMVREVHRRAAKGHNTIRIHSTGDFHSFAYFRSWLEIARRCPETRFFCYTRTWRVPAWRLVLAEAEQVSNLTLWWSTDPSTEVPTDAPRVAFILDPAVGSYSPRMPEPNCAKQNGGPKCVGCGLCMDRSRTTVTFRKH